MKRPIVFLDLYCGAGGFSTGFAEAMKDLGMTFREIAINHWFRAVETMRANHPGVYAMQMDIDAATTYDNVQGVFAVLEDGRLLDVRIRMLKPSELAAAHSFPKGYKLSGSRADQVKQIGNSVPVRTAKAIVKAIFGRVA